MRRKRVVKVLCLFIRVLVFIALVWTTLELKDRHPEVWWQMGNVTLLSYMCTFVFERSKNMLVQLIVGIVKVWIILTLMIFVVASYAYEFYMPLTICNIMAYIGYGEEQGFRHIYCLKIMKTSNHLCKTIEQLSFYKRIAALTLISYSTVTDLAKFLGLSTSSPFSLDT